MSFPECFYRYDDVDWTSHKSKTNENPALEPEYDPSDVAFKNTANAYVKGLVVEANGVWTPEDVGQLAACADADLIVTKDGRVLKNRYGMTTALPQVAVRPFVTKAIKQEHIKNALSCLSGNLSHDNVAKAKEILKKLL